MKRKLTLLTGLVIAATLTVSAFYRRGGDVEPVVTAEAVTRGSIVTTVSATGTLEAVKTVQVGSQVSGAVEALYADFNSIVRKGQVLARLEPSLYNSAIEQANANLIRAQADDERTRVSLADAEAKLARARELAARQLIPANDVETAEVARANADAQVRSSGAGVIQARASLDQARVNLAKTVIMSPIDGIVISRNVDVGQTVAASLSAPTLYLIAADLSQMQLSASIDESDLGQIAEGQPVRFTVDAYPAETFTGVVRQVRLNPIIASNVVTYAAIVTAPNPELKLKPGMTASLTIEVARRDDVLRAPAAALRFKPGADVLEALGAAAPGGRGSMVWQQTGETVAAVRVTTGITDGQWTELIDAPFTDGTPLVTRVVLGGGAQAVPASAPSTSPLMGTQPGRR
ncbi:MAG: efflux RND transporter periplasmic adaptor subunit [Vicinamibacterales bacterium]